LVVILDEFLKCHFDESSRRNLIMQKQIESGGHFLESSRRNPPVN